jgi:hypothetical protein
MNNFIVIQPMPEGYGLMTATYGDNLTQKVAKSPSNSKQLMFHERGRLSNKIVLKLVAQNSDEFNIIVSKCQTYSDSLSVFNKHLDLKSSYNQSNALNPCHENQASGEFCYCEDNSCRLCYKPGSPILVGNLVSLVNKNKVSSGAKFSENCLTSDFYKAYSNLMNIDIGNYTSFSCNSKIL